MLNLSANWRRNNRYALRGCQRQLVRAEMLQMLRDNFQTFYIRVSCAYVPVLRLTQPERGYGAVVYITKV